MQKQREYLKQKKQKKQVKMKELEEAREEEKNKWQSFNAKVYCLLDTTIIPRVLSNILPFNRLLKQRRVELSKSPSLQHLKDQEDESAWELAEFRADP